MTTHQLKPVEAVAIDFAGEAVGHAISLGARYAFYTTHPRLTHFDARRFDSLEDIRAAVADRLRPRDKAR